MRFAIIVAVSAIVSVALYGNDPLSSVNSGSATENRTESVRKGGVDPLSSVRSVNICAELAEAEAERAFDVGYRYGTALAEYDANVFLRKYEKLLDRAFRIGDLYIEGVLEPPKVVEGSRLSVSRDGKSYSVNEKSYIIESGARFVPKPKTWKDFLRYDPNPVPPEPVSPEPEIPERYKKRCYDTAVVAVSRALRKGADAGYSDEMTLFANRAKSIGDFLEKIDLYHILYYQRVINPPVVAEVSAGAITDEKGDILKIGAKTYTIVKKAMFNPTPRIWKAIVSR